MIDVIVLGHWHPLRVLSACLPFEPARARPRNGLAPTRVELYPRLPLMLASAPHEDERCPFRHRCPPAGPCAGRFGVTRGKEPKRFASHADAGFSPLCSAV